MAKVIYKGLAKKDDPIYTGKYVVSSFKKKIRNKVAEEKDDAITDLTEQEKLAIFKNRY